MHIIGSWLSWFATNWVALLVVLLAFGFIILVHELGHFLTAKRVGITVHEFALGFGPRVFSRKVDETEYCLRAFPFGGFVRMEGEDDPEADPNDPGSFQNKSVLSRLVVLGGGCFMNYVSATFALLLIGFVHGIPAIVHSNVVGGVVANSPAAKAGLQAGDRIVAVDGTTVGNFEALQQQIKGRGNMLTTISVLRDGKALSFQVTPQVAQVPGVAHSRALIGVRQSGIATIAWTPSQGARQVFAWTGNWVNQVTFLPLTIMERIHSHQMTVSQVREDSGGPLAIGQMLFELYHQGVWALMFLWAIICLSVGAFNLLPFPALDGARMLFVGLGAVRGRPLDPRKEGVVHTVGLAVLLLVMVMFTVQDVHRIFSNIHFF